MKKEELIEALREVYKDYAFEKEIEKCIILYPLSIELDKNMDLGVLKVHQPTPAEVEMFMEVMQNNTAERFLGFEHINEYITEANAQRKVVREAEEEEVREVRKKHLQGRLLKVFQANKTGVFGVKTLANSVNEDSYFLVEIALKDLVSEKLIDTEMQGSTKVFRFKKEE